MVEVVSSSYEQFTSNTFVETQGGLSAACHFTRDGTVLEGLRLMRSEALRLQSYRNWPSHLPLAPSDLAKAGLFYTGADDRVKCPFCLGVLKKWQPFDDPMTEHRELFPHCEFVLGHNVGNIPLLHFKTESETHQRKIIYNNDGVDIKPTETASKLTTALKPLKQTEAHAVKKPPSTRPPVLHTEPVKDIIQGHLCQGQDYSKEAVRLQSYTTWPPAVSQTPESLAYAGFYHHPVQEKPDRVKCAYCQGKLYNWRVGDDPMVEHAKCFPKCPYIKLCMGEQLIDELLHQHEHSTNVKEPDTTDYIDAVESKRPDVISAVLDMGFPELLVTKVAHNYTRDELSDVTVSQIVDKLLETENETKIRVTSVVNGLTPLKVPGNQRANEIASRHSEKTSSCIRSAGNRSGRDTAPRLPHAHNRENTGFKSDVSRCVFLPCGHDTSLAQHYMSTRNCPDCGEPLTGTVFI